MGERGERGGLGMGGQHGVGTRHPPAPWGRLFWLGTGKCGANSIPCLTGAISSPVEKVASLKHAISLFPGCNNTGS